MNYGPFTSHAPTYDSSFSNISKDESDLVYSFYGEESSLQGSDRSVQCVHQWSQLCIVQTFLGYSVLTGEEVGCFSSYVGLNSMAMTVVQTRTFFNKVRVVVDESQVCDNLLTQSQTI